MMVLAQLLRQLLLRLLLLLLLGQQLRLELQPPLRRNLISGEIFSAVHTHE